MKKVSFFFLCLMVVLLGFSALPAIGQTKSKPTKHRVVKKVDPLISEAEKDWPQFWTIFKRSIRRGEDETVRTLISTEFSFYDLDWDTCKRSHFSDVRDAVVCRYSKEWSDSFAYIFLKASKVGRAVLQDGKILKRISSDPKGEHGRVLTFSYDASRGWLLIEITGWGL